MSQSHQVEYEMSCDLFDSCPSFSGSTAFSECSWGALSPSPSSTPSLLPCFPSRVSALLGG